MSSLRRSGPPSAARSAARSVARSAARSTAVAITASVALAASFVALPSACRPTSCTLVGCSSEHASLTAHVNAPLPRVAGAKTTVCWRELCSDLVVAGADAGTTAATSAAVGFDPRSSLLVGDAKLTSEGDGARLGIELQFYTRGRDGDLVYVRQANGDRYRITIVDAAGATLLDAERVATYEESYPNGPDCDPDPCRRVSLDFSAP